MEVFCVERLHRLPAEVKVPRSVLRRAMLADALTAPKPAPATFGG